MRYQFVDCRWSLADPALGRRLYLDSHIPGASFLNVAADLSGPPGANGRHPLPEAEKFAAAAARAGIGADVFVIAYGTTGGAERLWWLLRHFGHDDCAVLDLDAWQGPLQSGPLRDGEEQVAPQHLELQRFEPRERGGDTVSLEELNARLSELVVTDARLPARWRGEPNDVDRVSGRIPGALNAPWNEPLPELPSGELVAYCGSGITACVLLHSLHLAGRAGRLYPGSWSEWEQHPELPFERGE
ncbi:MAG TPA: rhodanese-like domain-containing protein [Gaiellaceae bacterium]